MMMIATMIDQFVKEKAFARLTAKAHRVELSQKDIGASLIDRFETDASHSIIAGFAPLKDEIDLWPLLYQLHGEGHTLCLPVTPAKPSPLSFRIWTPETKMATDRFGVSYPASGPEVTPDFVFVPLLAFTPKGQRLGYGGGFYDRTLAKLRAEGEVFACGVAYAGQEVSALPTDDHDERLDGILTETGFRKF